MRLLYTCKRCGAEYGAGEEDRGLSPCCLAEGDPCGAVYDEEDEGDDEPGPSQGSRRP